MPASTPVYGITYPCGGDTIDAAAIATFAQTLDAALAQGQLDLDAATSKPNAQVYSTTNASVTIATDTTLTFTTELYDTDAMADLAVSNDRLTIQTRGVYFIGMSAAIVGGFTTITSLTGIIQVNGADFYRYKTRKIASATDVSVSYSLPVDLNPGDFVQARVRWTGTGGPATVQTRSLHASLMAAH